MIEPELLRTFVAFAESGSFTLASQRVHRTQSAVSMQMKRLEEQIGRPLFARNGRGIDLTRDGETLLGHARRILLAHREALAALSPSELAGTVTIGSPDDYASTFLPGILARFAETHPKVHVQLVCDTSDVLLVKRLASSEVDLALVTEGSGETDGILLRREPLVWAGSAQHDTHLLDPLPLALFHQGCCFRRNALAALARQGRPARVAYTSVSVAGVKAAMTAGLAIGVLARSTVDAGLRVLGERDGLPPLPTIGIMLVRADAQPSPLIDALTEHVLDSFCASQQLAA